ncbi:hypothetical protein PF005_g8674 [Phytophthora fragariae]|nr:hypothetical protein PF003_g12265 [Phytophthora fragariae]KAE8940126.1 hypothetical protein PF009_g10046 [Phytophthora fragariae]KAE9015212.1 hypothetical protein PF011_g7717 [Phytophthora fragariae]KAE9118527.1 hypothetical protein PF007_g8889 [Phytophthora fragariae]KAE9147218.1 hypothetical protein PF006_g8077 [Phytophthora fragariae]
MKIICPRVLTPLVIFAAAASVKIVEGGIEASAYYEDANCTSSALVVNIGGDCSGDTFSCPVYDTPGTSEMCFPDLTVLLTTGLGGGRHLVVEYYTDADCTSLSSAGAYLADGLCHEFTQFDGSRQSETTVVSSNGSVSVVGTLGGCKSSDTFYHAYPIPSANITGECIAVDMPPRGDANMTHGAKFYYVP